MRRRQKLLKHCANRTRPYPRKTLLGTFESNLRERPGSTNRFSGLSHFVAITEVEAPTRGAEPNARILPPHLPLDAAVVVEADLPLLRRGQGKLRVLVRCEIHEPVAPQKHGKRVYYQNLLKCRQ